jgi:WhiB family transcriptional regulator, redox-sensing transcriptional regulator
VSHYDRRLRAVRPGAAVASDLFVIYIESPEWMERGLCGEVDGDAWFPEKGGSTYMPKKICRACPVRSECLDYAMEHGERHGVWGGLSERERNRLAKEVA